MEIITQTSKAKHKTFVCSECHDIVAKSIEVSLNGAAINPLWLCVKCARKLIEHLILHINAIRLKENE